MDMSWLDGRFENSGHLLVSLHWPSTLVLWDTAKGTKVWKNAPEVTPASNSSVFLGFDLDPFDSHRMVLRTGNNDVVFVNDFKISKSPARTSSLQVSSNN